MTFANGLADVLALCRSISNVNFTCSTGPSSSRSSIAIWCPALSWFFLTASRAMSASERAASSAPAQCWEIPALRDDILTLPDIGNGTGALLRPFLLEDTLERNVRFLQEKRPASVNRSIFQRDLRVRVRIETSQSLNAVH